MKRRDIIRNAAAGSLLVTGVGSAQVTNSGSGSTVYKLEENGGTLEVVDTFDGGGVGSEHHCDSDDPDCCVDKCCNCGSDCGVCYCHEYCDDEQEN
jgi:hypothetical protein